MDTKVFDLQFKALCLCGIVPPRNTYNKKWKRIIFAIYSSLALFSYIPIIVTELIALTNYFSNIDMAVTIIFQMWVFTYTGIVSYYFAMRRNAIISVFQKLENGLSSHVEKIGLPEINLIIKRDIKHANFLTKTTMILCWFVVCAWELSPYVMRCITVLIDSGKVERNVIVDKWKYYCVITWLPESANQSPMYDIIYAMEAFVGYVTVVGFTACNMVFYSFLFHISTHFKILIASLESMDKIFLNNITEEEVGRVKDTLNKSKSNGGTMFHGVSTKDKLEIGKNYQHRSRDSVMNMSKCSKKMTNSRTSNIIRNNFSFRSPVVVNEDKLESCKEDQMCNYLINCICYHQAIIEFCKEVNEILSPALMIFFISSQALLCLPAFLLALGLSDTLFKLFTAIIDAFIWPVIVCLHGDRLSDLSLAVQQAAYSCRWYDRSAHFKKLLHILIIRAQKPVQFSAGKFYVVSLETLADIVHKVYAYFTVLKHLHET